MSEKEEKTSANVNSPLANPIENKMFSNEFRETLIKSGLDASAFKVEELEVAPLSNESSPSPDIAKTGIEEVSSKRARIGRNLLPNFGWRRSHLLAVAAIVAIIIFQSVFQFSLVQEENLRVAENLIRSDMPLETVVEKRSDDETPQINPTIEAKEKPEKELKTKTVNQPKNNALETQHSLRIMPARTTFRKKESRESTAERLRRAERILTGV